MLKDLLRISLELNKYKFSLLNYLKYDIIKIGDGMKKGFTLIELTAVIILIALISVLGFTLISNNINSKKDEISEAMNKIIFEASNIYMGYNQKNYLKIDDNIYCIKLSNLIDLDLLSKPLIDPVSNEEISLDKYVKIEVNAEEYLYSVVDDCTEKR